MSKHTTNYVTPRKLSETEKNNIKDLDNLAQKGGIVLKQRKYINNIMMKIIKTEEKLKSIRL